MAIKKFNSEVRFSLLRLPVTKMIWNFGDLQEKFSLPKLAMSDSVCSQSGSTNQSYLLEQLQKVESVRTSDKEKVVLPDKICWLYLSLNDYSEYCCCLENDDSCGYAPHQKKYIEENKKEWVNSHMASGYQIVGDYFKKDFSDLANDTYNNLKLSTTYAYRGIYYKQHRKLLKFCYFCK